MLWSELLGRNPRMGRHPSQAQLTLPLRCEKWLFLLRGRGLRLSERERGNGACTEHSPLLTVETAS